MLSYTYLSPGKFGLIRKPKPVLRHDRDAIVRVTLSSICTSDLHIKHGTVPRAVPGVTVGHEMVGIVESVGAEVSTVKPGDRCRSTWRPSAAHVSSANTDMSTTAPIPTAAGHWGVELTAVRQNMSGFLMRIKVSPSSRIR